MPDPHRTGHRQVQFAGKPYHSPVLQGIAILVSIIITVSASHIMHISETAEWYMTATFLLLFTAGNPIMGIFKQRWYPYIGKSFLVYLVLFGLALGITEGMARVGLQELGGFKYFFLIIFIFYLMITFLVGLYRLIIKILHTAA